MYRINRFRIEGFRRLREVDLEVRPLMVLIGANGVGKTSLLDAFSLLSASAAGKLNQTLSQLGGFTSLLTRNKKNVLDYSILRETLSQERDDPENHFKHISSEIQKILYYDIEEKRLKPPNWEHDQRETSLAQVPKMYKQPEELRLLFSKAAHYHMLDVGPRAPVKLPQQMKPALLPGADGEDLFAYLYSLREGNRDRFKMIMDSLQAAFPDFEELNFPAVAAGMLAMTWRDKKFDEPMYMNELSEGTLRFLWLASLLQSPYLPTITMIDEPEVSLHPELLSILADLMREAAKRTQLIVATHSDRLVRFLEPQEVLVMDLDEEGCATATWADSLDLEHWLAEYTLDEVWRMGRMGGRS